MDTRLELTDKQKKLVEQLEQLFKDFEKENVVVIPAFGYYGTFDGFMFYNKTEVLDEYIWDNDDDDVEEEYKIDNDDSKDDTDDYLDDYDDDAVFDFVDEDTGKVTSMSKQELLRIRKNEKEVEVADKDDAEPNVWYTPDMYDLPHWRFESNPLYNHRDIWFSVLLKRDDKELSAFYKRRENYRKLQEEAKELAPLNGRRNMLKEKMQRYEDAVTDGEDYIHRLEKGGLSQEIIEEAKEKIESSKVEYDKLQKEIKSLNDEIEKVKAKYEG